MQQLAMEDAKFITPMTFRYEHTQPLTFTFGGLWPGAACLMVLWVCDGTGPDV